ncbi:RICIN domain-containing protein [Aquimarina sp. RZ0]|uniref:RICIN domain-containing protein n=1 Tax=Aquimarina sp. RZ0 TaxID=2607730 RepID=UPI0011F3B708|nr:RICIN domain-containing protein [Aquimarina sp. RZ0]KAA1247637.1 T9SS type A sorting domain-containing protein [Aquimarina sp. RZ0]
MKIIQKLLLVGVLFNFISLMAQEKDWIQSAQQSGANFYEIRNEISKRFEEKKKNKQVEVISKSNNIKIIGENDFVKFRRWEWYMSQRVHQDGTFPSSLELQQGYDDFVNKEQSITAKAAGATWTNISRTSNDGGYWSMGRTTDIGFHPSNANIFWVCGQKGGVWKTTDGGSTYIPQGDNLPFLGAGAIVVNHANPDILYVTTGDNTGGRGMGVYKSTNGGTTWSPTGFTRNLSNGVVFYNLVQSPTNPAILLVATNLGVYRTINAGDNWTRVASGRATDITFSNSDNGSTAFSIINNRFYKSTNQGQSFSIVNNGPSHSGLGRITLNNANVNRVISWSNAGIWVSNDNGNSWTEKNKATYPNGSIVNFDAMTTSPYNANTLYGGQLDVFRSDDNGATWTQISKWHGGTSITEVHADHRNMVCNPINGLIYSCNDGGIDAYNERENSIANRWSRHSDGLVIPQYYHAASSESNGAIIGVGSQDNGGSFRDSSLTWKNSNGGDAGTQAIDPQDSDIRYSNYNPSPNIIRTTNGWQNSRDVKPDDVNESWWVIPYVLDPNDSKRIVAGYHAVYTSDNRGDSWEKISPDFSASDAYWEVLRSIAVAPSDSNVIYAGGPRRFHYTYDKGNTWGYKDFNQDITSITVDPNDAKTVYITFGHFSNGMKVNKSVDGGVNWTNISAGIPNIPVYSIVTQKDAEEVLYIGTEFGVFYKDASMTSWKVYGTKLPKTQVHHLHINYHSRKLRAATYGRGIYETALDGETELPCEAATNIALTAATDTTLNITWPAIPNNNNYYTFHKKQSTSEWIHTLAPTNSVILQNLEPETIYDVVVGVACTNGNRILSSTLQFKTLKDNSLIPGGIYEIKSSLPDGRNLDVSNGGTAVRTNVQIWEDNGTQPQRWIARNSNEEGYYILSPQHAPDKALDVKGGVNADGTNIHIWTADINNISQKWKIESSGDSYVALTPKVAPGRYLDISNGQDSNGVNVQIWGGNGTPAQQWILEYIGPSSNNLSVAENLAQEQPLLSKEKTIVYPNPVREQFTINFKKTSEELGNVQVELINSLGVVVKNVKTASVFTNGNIQIYTDSLTKGVYTLVIKNGNGQKIHTQKLLIRR